MKLDYGFAPAQGEVLATAGQWTLVRGAGFPTDPAALLLERLFVEVFPAAVAQLSSERGALLLCAKMPLQCKGIVVLGGELEKAYWDADDAVGLHAICGDRQEPTAQEEEEGADASYDVNESNVGVVLLDSIVAAMREGEPDGANVLSALETLPYVMSLVSQWLEASGGLSPLEVVDRRGFLALRDVRAVAGQSARERGHVDGAISEAEKTGAAVATACEGNIAASSDFADLVALLEASAERNPETQRQA